MRVSHDAIYQALYIHGRGALRGKCAPACTPGGRCVCRRRALKDAENVSSHQK
jgi:hypothetical protein